MLKRHISIGVFVVYIDTGSPVPNIPSKSCDLADENKKNFWRNGNDSKQRYWGVCYIVSTFCIVKPVLRVHLWKKEKWPYKTGDLLKEVQLICHDKKKMTF
jgi:hypothetical protein